MKHPELRGMFELVAGEIRGLLAERRALHPIEAVPMDRVFLKGPPVAPRGSFGNLQLVEISQALYRQPGMTKVAFATAWDNAIQHAVHSQCLVRNPAFVLGSLTAAMPTAGFGLAPGVSTLGILAQALQIASWNFGHLERARGYLSLDLGQGHVLKVAKGRLDGVARVRRMQVEPQNNFSEALDIPVGAVAASTPEAGALMRRLLDYLPEMAYEIEAVFGAAIHSGDLQIQYDLANEFGIRRSPGAHCDSEFANCVRLTYRTAERPYTDFAALLSGIVKDWSHPFFAASAGTYTQEARLRDRLDLLALQRSNVRPDTSGNDAERREALHLAHLIQSI